MGNLLILHEIDKSIISIIKEFSHAANFSELSRIVEKLSIVEKDTNNEYPNVEITDNGDIRTADQAQSLLNDSGVEVSKKDVNKILLHLEIMNLISVRWMGKNSKRIELSKTDHEKSNALW